ncbi:hypothetical protein [Streptomyces sp. NPDC057257]|uniref:hypothetical protein n=1 Tax=Streptomyces sp. NPDC057257 TaxID=3346071 RepID=UPI003626FFEC
MSNAHLLVEAVDTAVTLSRAVIGWLIFLATAAAILSLAAIATGATAVRAVWRRAAEPSWARGRLRAQLHGRARIRRPSERTRPLDDEQPTRPADDPDPDDEDDDLHCHTLTRSPS